MSDTKNDIAWKQLFEKYKILERIKEHGAYEITSEQINEFREARLMTKFDHRNNLPKIFKKHKLSILPVSRGSYIISQFETYQDIEEKETEIVRVPFPSYIESLDYENITSEATALSCAYVSGIIADFVEDEEVVPTVSGRMNSEAFNFNINTFAGSPFQVGVTNAQIEIDGGFEGLETFSLIEAKNSLSDDFIIRQLYYPYRLWNGRVSKKVKSIFMIYSNGIFTFCEYEFREPENYNSLILIKQKRYSIEETEISLKDISEVFNRTKIVQEPEIPFPQADSFKRVINLCELLNESDLTRDEITANYDFDPRQTNYYTDAGRYLGLIDKRREGREAIFSLTDEGRRLLRLKYKPRQLKLVELILSHRVFNETFKLSLKRGEIPTIDEIVQIMKRCDLYNVGSKSTFRRRASTISGWIKWILELTKNFNT
ncbi:MAG: transcriptional regulator [Firmicutes bacterium]|jgi:DNA-binding transcriptional ArsR family regulator|nr:transcriptional regulator [Bacillota bacterium]